jgi:hypothetical protein
MTYDDLKKAWDETKTAAETDVPFIATLVYEVAMDEFDYDLSFLPDDLTKSLLAQVDAAYQWDGPEVAVELARERIKELLAVLHQGGTDG